MQNDISHGHHSGHAVEQSLAGGPDDGTQTQEEMAVRPSEPNLDEGLLPERHGAGMVDVKTERSAAWSNGEGGAW